MSQFKSQRDLDIEAQWQKYLKLVGLEEAKLPDNQRIEMKQVFFGAFGQLLILVRDEMGVLEEETAMDVFQYLMDQVGVFFLRASDRQN